MGGAEAERELDEDGLKQSLSLSNKLAEKINEHADLENYQLFLCSSGAESIENALKLASFHTNKKE